MVHERAPVELVCLDAGNTLIGIDHQLISTELLSHGIEVDGGAVARAESRARRIVSEYLVAGRSSEATPTREVYARAMLDALPIGVADLSGSIAMLLEWLGKSENMDRLWNVVAPGTDRALEALGRAGIRRVVVSNSDGGIERRLGDAGLLPYLDDVIDSGAVGIEKPDPRIFELALERTGTPSQRAIHVGDLPAVDVVGATAAGLEGWLMDPFGEFSDFDGPRLQKITDLPSRLGLD